MARKRKFGGKTYTREGVTGKKAIARMAGRKLQKKGYSYRIVKERDKAMLFIAANAGDD